MDDEDYITEKYANYQSLRNRKSSAKKAPVNPYQNIQMGERSTAATLTINHSQRAPAMAQSHHNSSQARQSSTKKERPQQVLQARTPGSPFKSLEAERNEYQTPTNRNPLQMSTARAGKFAQSEFNTSKGYAYQKMKFEWDRAQKGDKVNLYQEFNSAWKSDRFLNNNYKYTSI